MRKEGEDSNGEFEKSEEMVRKTYHGDTEERREAADERR
jgi:hypothetical protein